MPRSRRAYAWVGGAASSDEPTRRCDSPGCPESGIFRAPKDRSAREYYWFCLDHVREYNAKWDFFSGMNMAEIEAYQKGNPTWHRPTWRLGESPGSPKTASGFEWVDPMDIVGAGDFSARANREARRPPEKKIDPESKLAFEELDIEPPATLQEIKTRYKQLVKRFHPDANGGDKTAEEHLKRINRAYSVLKARVTA